MANDNKPYRVQRNVSQTRNRCAPSLCSSRRPWAELSSKCTRDVLASGIESRSSNYPEKLRRFCIRMREYLDRWKGTESKEEEGKRKREKRGMSIREGRKEIVRDKESENSGEGCTLQRRRSISGLHFVLRGSLGAFPSRSLGLSPRSPPNARIRCTHSLEAVHACTRARAFRPPFPSPLSTLVISYLLSSFPFLFSLPLSVLRVDLEGSSEGMLRAAHAQLARY